MKPVRNFNWLGWCGFGLLLLLWEFGARATPNLQFYFPPLSKIFLALGDSFLTA